MNIDESTGSRESRKFNNLSEKEVMDLNLKNARPDFSNQIDDEKLERLQLGYSNGHKTLLFGSRKEMQPMGAVKDLVRTKQPIANMYASLYFILEDFALIWLL